MNALLYSFVALGQTVPNPGLDPAGTLPSQVPNTLPLDVPGWDLDPANALGPADLASVGLPVHCLDLLVDSDGNADSASTHFVHAVAVLNGADEVGQRLATNVTDLVVGETYRLTFEAALVRHYGLNPGAWRVAVGGQVFDTGALTVPLVGTQTDWRTFGFEFVADDVSMTLRFEAFSFGSVGTIDQTLPVGACQYESPVGYTEVLLDTVQVWLDTDGDGEFDDTDLCPTLPSAGPGDHDGDDLSDEHELDHWETDPCRADSDGDGLSDFYEIMESDCLDPNDADSDDDGPDPLTEEQTGPGGGWDGDEVTSAVGTADFCQDPQDPVLTVTYDLGTPPCDRVADLDEDGLTNNEER
ncbi:MAG: hypothetical protein AAF602_07385, partial [Myxococcota bacterium]